MYKEKFEEEQRKRLECEKEFARQVEHLSEKKAEVKVKVLRQQNEEMREANLDKYHDELKKVKKHNELLDAKVTDLKKHTEELASELKLYDEFRSVLRRMLPQQRQPGFEPGLDVSSEVSVTIEQPALILKKKQEPLELSQNNVDGRIAIAYAEGLFDTKWFTKKRLNTILEQRFGKKEAYPNLQKPLTNMTAWGYFEFHMAGPRKEWRVKLAPKEARGKGLLKEVVV